jgi:hypothetical protein
MYEAGGEGGVWAAAVNPKIKRTTVETKRYVRTGGFPSLRADVVKPIVWLGFHDVLNGFLPFISSNSVLHFGHLMMWEARRTNSFGGIL